MAKIPDFTALGNAPPRAPGGSPRVSGATAVADAVSDLGSTAFNILDRKYQKDEAEAGRLRTDQLAEAEKDRQRQNRLAFATAKSEFTTFGIDFQSKITENPEYQTWEERYTAGIGKKRSEIASKIVDPDYRAQFELDTADDVARSSAIIRNGARTRFTETQRAGVEQLVDQTADAALRTADPKTRGDLMSSMNGAIDTAVEGGLFTGTWGVEAKRKTAERIAEGTVNQMELGTAVRSLRQGMTVKDGQRQFGKTGTVVDFIPPERRSAMLDQREAELEQRARQARSDAQFRVSADLEDAKAAAGDGQDWTRIVNPGDIRAAYGDARSERLIGALNFQMQTGQQLKAVALASPEEQGAMLAEAKPVIFSKGALPDGSLPGRQGNLDRTKAGDNWATFEVSEDGIPSHLVLPTMPGDNNKANDETGFLGDAVERYRKTGKYYGGFDTDEAGANAMRGTPTGGYAQQSNRAEALARAISQKRDMLAKDPAAFVLQYSPQSQALAQRAFGPEGSPKDLQAYAAAMLAEQRRLGVPEADVKPLTTGQADGIAGAISVADTPQKRLAAAIPILGFGEDRDIRRAMAQVVKAGGPPDLPYALEAYRSGNKSGATRIMQASQAEVKLTGDARTEVMENVTDAFSDYDEVLRTQSQWTGNPMSAALAITQADLIGRMTSVTGNAQQATADVTGHLKPIMDDNLGAVLVPQAIDEGALRGGMIAKRNALLTGNIFATLQMPGAPSVVQRYEQAIAEDMRDDSHWVNVGSRLGLALPGGIMLSDQNGKTLTFDPAEIALPAGTKPAPAFNPFPDVQ